MTETPDIKGGSKRRRKLLWVAVAVLAIGLLIALPAFIGTRPGFLGRYTNLDAQHEAWQTSAHSSVNCGGCHVEPGVLAQVAYGGRMLGEFYLHWVARDRELDVLTTPTNDACARCHLDLRTVSASGDLLIPHKAHVDVLEMECVACHDHLVHEETPEGTNKPRMEACMECHDGEQAKDTCEACHTEKGAPDNHATPDWLIVHADEPTEECEECHGWTDDWCTECHTRRPPSHVEKWRSVHRDRVAERRNCEVCHEADFCIRCHGEVPSLNLEAAIAPAP
jgi:hypothetical protein